jgi:hypothetical protein
MHRIRLDPLLKRFIIHIPNEGKRSLRYGKSLKDMGMRAGVFDLFIIMARHGYHGAWIELKSRKGKLSEEQLIFQNDMRQQNYFTVVCYSVDEALETIQWYCYQDKSPQHRANIPA